VDIALAIPSAVSFQATESAIRSSAGKWLAKLQLFDVFEGPPLEAGMKSFAFHALLQAKDRTLSEKEEQQFLTKVSQVAKDLGGKLRQ
jgi:phenylalanyl-tRNA synthetase beta chain